MSVSFSQLGKQGRLANQLFQLSATICHALNNNDTYVFPEWPYERYFGLHGCFSGAIRPSTTYSEPYFHYAKIPYSPNMDLSGYYQSKTYFAGHEDLIVDLFTPTYELDTIPNTTSIHVRHGDYLNLQQCHPVMAMDYYERAMKTCLSDKYLVFSDDIEWCKRNFVGKQFEFVEGQHETLDLAMMAKCANQIICNSSFSWWGAFLNRNPSKTVVAPALWFGPKLPLNTKDLLPTDWKIV